MTEDKEIIIDGVNVVGCKHYNMQDCEINNYYDTCRDDSDCYYKQLKRLEQERDFWQNKSSEFENLADKLVKEKDELKQENRELKAYKDVNEDFKKAWDELSKIIDCKNGTIETLKQENERLRKEINLKKDMIVEFKTKLHLEIVGHKMALAERIEAQKIGNKYKRILEEIYRNINLAYKTEDYLLGQDYTDLVNRIQKELDGVL